MHLLLTNENKYYSKTYFVFLFSKDHKTIDRLKNYFSELVMM